MQFGRQYFKNYDVDIVRYISEHKIKKMSQLLTAVYFMYFCPIACVKHATTYISTRTAFIVLYLN